MMSSTPFPRCPRLSAASLALALGVTALVGCGDDESAQDRYCDAAESLNESVSALFDVDVIAEGVNGVRSAVDNISNDLAELRDNASDAAADEVEALGGAVDQLEAALAAAAGSLTADNATGVVDAIGSVQSAFGAIGATLTDC